MRRSVRLGSRGIHRASPTLRPLTELRIGPPQWLPSRPFAHGELPPVWSLEATPPRGYRQLDFALPDRVNGYTKPPPHGITSHRLRSTTSIGFDHLVPTFSHAVTSDLSSPRSGGTITCCSGFGAGQAA